MNSGVTGFHQLFLLVLIAFLVALIARKLRVSYALALVVTGLATGVSHLLPKAHLDPAILMTVFLPPLLFESAFNLQLDLLKRDWRAISVYTLIGTFSSTIIIGLITSVLMRIPLIVGLLFGALISTTDPISVIAIFRRLGAGKRLTLIMEAESLFNNDIAVVLYTVIIGIASGGSFSYSSAALQFVQLALGGAILGTIIGLLASRLHYELNDHLIEITLTTVVAFGSYLVADRIGVSPVMTVVAAGVTLGSYGTQTSMSASTQLAVSAFWEYLAFLVNSVVFLLIGIEAAFINWGQRAVLALVASLIVLVGRAAIYPISLLVNRIGGNIPRSWQHVLVWGGLRGALSMALVLGISPRFRYMQYRDVLVAATFGAVLFSLLVQGSTVGVMLRRLGLTTPDHPSIAPGLHTLEAELAAIYGGLAEIERLQTLESHPTWALQQISKEYRDREAELYVHLEILRPGYTSHLPEMLSLAREPALLAEKSALAAARKKGSLEDAEFGVITARIDAELVELRKQRDSGNRT